MTTLTERLNPNNINTNTNQYSQNNSLYLVAASLLVYKTSDSIDNVMTEVNHTYGTFQHHKFFEVSTTDTQYMFIGNNRFVVIAFRGTEFKLLDFLTDLKINVYQNTISSHELYYQLPAGHGGFRRSLMESIEDGIFDKLNSFLSQHNINKNTPILLTGHSLGGALSTLLIKPLVVSGFNFCMAYNFASPLCISKTDVPNINNEFYNQIYDIVNYKDYVPRASKKSRKRLGRVGKFYWIDRKKNIKRKKKVIQLKFSFKEKLNFFHFIAKYHKLINYGIAIDMPQNIVSNVE